MPQAFFLPILILYSLTLLWILGRGRFLRKFLRIGLLPMPLPLPNSPSSSSSPPPSSPHPGPAPASTSPALQTHSLNAQHQQAQLAALVNTNPWLWDAPPRPWSTLSSMAPTNSSTRYSELLMEYQRLRNSMSFSSASSHLQRSAMAPPPSSITNEPPPISPSAIHWSDYYAGTPSQASGLRFTPSHGPYQTYDAILDPAWDLSTTRHAPSTPPVAPWTTEDLTNFAVFSPSQRPVDTPEPWKPNLRRDRLSRS